tara:strand:+ start:1033 stop:2565 length:1533 start_codon:yes stop_codon:yes gene_type:complete
MKLVRLTSASNTALFDNQFNDEINLEPNSEIALQNLSLELVPKELVVDLGNHDIKWTIDAVDYEGVLTAGVYNKTNVARLLFDIESTFNDTIDGGHDVDDYSDIPVGGELGTQWTAMINEGDVETPGHNSKKPRTTKQIVIGYRHARTTEKLSTKDWEVTGVGAVAGHTQRFARTDASSGDNAAFCAGKFPLTWGCGGFGIETGPALTDDGGAADNVQGVFIGLTATKPVAGDPIDRADCEFGIQAPFNGTKYIIWKGGVEADAIEDVTAGDSMSFERYAGVIYAVKYDSAANRSAITYAAQTDGAYIEHAQSDNEAYPLYPVIIVYGSDTSTEFEIPVYNPDPFLYAAEPATTHSKNLHVPNNPEIPVAIAIELSQDVANFLGYNQNFRYPVTLGATAYENFQSFGWFAPIVFSTAGVGDSFYVQLLSLGCEGYDGRAQGNQNILATIPSMDTVVQGSARINFSSSFPLFLEINNRNAISLRNIRTRVLTSDGAAVATNGINQMTLLFK